MASGPENSPPAGERAPAESVPPAVVPAPLPPTIWTRYSSEPARIRTGNRARLLRDGAAAFPEMLAAIAGAKKHINLASYIFASDGTGRDFSGALAERARAGVHVNVIYDAIGSSDSAQDVFDVMTDAGVNVIEYHPIRPWRPRWGWWRRDHRKILVVDGVIGFTGGINIADLNAPLERGGGGWRDTHVKIEGPVVADLQASFIAVWRRAGGRRLHKRDYLPSLVHVGATPARVVGNTLLWNRWSIRRAILAAFRAATRNIWIANAYFVPDAAIVGELIRARGRGVDVRIMVPRKSDVRVVAYASRNRYQWLLDEGIRIFEWTGPMLHAKTIVVDGVWSGVGTFNFDRWSLVNNLEVTVNLFDPAVAVELERMFIEDQARCVEVTREAWLRRAGYERMLESLAGLLSPWL
ncbi:MAG TPA: phospholipase D-like domain-containing protein [bacterium]|nr:phospholipase D-like domain-containing protein [bacterium]